VLVCDWSPPVSVLSPVVVLWSPLLPPVALAELSRLSEIDGVLLPPVPLPEPRPTTYAVEDPPAPPWPPAPPCERLSLVEVLVFDGE